MFFAQLTKITFLLEFFSFWSKKYPHSILHDFLFLIIILFCCVDYRLKKKRISQYIEKHIILKYYLVISTDMLTSLYPFHSHINVCVLMFSDKNFFSLFYLLNAKWCWLHNVSHFEIYTLFPFCLLHIAGINICFPVILSSGDFLSFYYECHWKKINK